LGLPIVPLHPRFIALDPPQVGLPAVSAIEKERAIAGVGLDGDDLSLQAPQRLLEGVGADLEHPDLARYPRRQGTYALGLVPVRLLSGLKLPP